MTAPAAPGSAKPQLGPPPETPFRRESSFGLQLWANISSQLKRSGSKTLWSLKELCKDDSMFVRPEQILPGKRVGKGAFASVEMCGYTGKDGKSCPVAVKHLNPELLEEEGELNRFVGEAKLLHSIRHEYITKFVGLGGSRREGGGLYIVQEYMNAGTIKSLVMKQMGEVFRRVYTYDEAFEWLIQMAKGLAHLHGMGVIHRDLKLENVLLTQCEPSPGKVAKLADFGLSALMKEPGCGEAWERKMSDATVEAEAPVDGHASPRLSPRVNPTLSFKNRIPTFTPKRVPTVKKLASLVRSKEGIGAKYELTGRTGSLMYMAPEVFRCEKYNEKVDVFSFSIIMYEMLRKSVLLVFVATTGSPSDVENYAKNVVKGMRPPIPEEWPADLVDLVKDCWHQDPDKRPTMKEVIPRLEQLKETRVLAEKPRSAATRCCSIQ
eukprot:evm.model.scf_46EXC.5 EVM.evm.TU.scf_46EXC.5   scf_46EXC:142986-145882(-)